MRLFRDLGVRVMQLTYNTQNLVGSGCWESRDSGLSDYGRDVIDLMNELGILVDLSHVGDTTSSDAIAHSKKPVAYTHCFPNAIMDHPRNESDEMLKKIADKGGFVGVVAYTPFMPKGDDSTIEDVLEPYLIQQGFMVRTPRGRMATRNAYQHFGLPQPTSAVGPASLPLDLEGGAGE